MAEPRLRERPVPTPKAATQPQMQADRQQQSMLQFDPRNLVGGIAFHAVDEGKAIDVMSDSVRKTIARVERSGLRPEIDRGVWQNMTHAERLEWLLAQSGTSLRIAEGLAVLEAA